LRVAIVGCGAVAQHLYAKPLRQLERRGLVRVVALVDPVDTHAAAMGRAFRRAVRYTALDAAMSSAEVDLTLILSPAHLHCVQVIEALRHGSHVLCEKPMASTAVDCVRMNDVAGDGKRVLAVGMIRRFFPAFAELQRILSSDALGPLLGFSYREGHAFEWDVRTAAAFAPRAQGGTGVLFDIGPHVLDALDWFFGPLEVRSYADDALLGIESNCVLAVKAERCQGDVHLSWDAPQANELRIQGSAAEVVLRVDRFDQLAIARDDVYQPVSPTVAFPTDLTPVGGRHFTPRTYGDAVYCQVVQVLRAIHLAEAPAADGEAGCRTVAALESALAMAEPLPMPWLDANERRRFEELHWSARS